MRPSIFSPKQGFEFFAYYNFVFLLWDYFGYLTSSALAPSSVCSTSRWGGFSKNKKKLFFSGFLCWQGGLQGIYSALCRIGAQGVCIPITIGDNVERLRLWGFTALRRSYYWDYAAVAQSVECVLGKDEVMGSNPISSLYSTKFGPQ
jgi:hypothetical protein